MDNFFGMEVEFDNVKYEKENAMQRFNKFRKMKKILFGVLMLILSMKKIPIFVKFSCKVFELWVYFLNPHFVFIIGNSIILALFLLCKQYDAENSTENDIFKAYSGQNEAFEVDLTSSLTFEVALTSPLTTEMGLTSPDAENGTLGKEELVAVAVENVECEASEVAIAAAEQEIRRFERTLSEKLKREIGVRQKKELRRSETENCRPAISHGGGGERLMVKSTFKTVEHLSNEDFKLAIDAFIDKHKIFFNEQINGGVEM
ncbi:hypothetical protein LIER_42892 [Lithospermum erythrorhizon]|uniref:DUF4408 domain-containing protein n=1 Tax=Lithospermum erythrorhizon TaxID=34254 RepID=A0AAV3P7W4_LITER